MFVKVAKIYVFKGIKFENRCQDNKIYKINEKATLAMEAMALTN